MLRFYSFRKLRLSFRLSVFVGVCMFCAPHYRGRCCTPFCFARVHVVSDGDPPQELNIVGSPITVTEGKARLCVVVFCGSDLSALYVKSHFTSLLYSVWLFSLSRNKIQCQQTYITWYSRLQIITFYHEGVPYISH